MTTLEHRVHVAERRAVAAVVEPPADMAGDPVLFARRSGWEPDPWQASVLTSESKRVLLNCSRQSGKSTVAAAVAVWTAVYQPTSLVLMVSASLRQSQELFRTALRIYRAVNEPVPPDAETKLTLELSNGSRLISLPSTEATIRGFSNARLLVVDEAARVDDGIYYAIRPMLAISGGRLLALSTPFGKRGWWHREWSEGGSAWERYEVPASECPRISAAFLEEERRSLGPMFYSSEYECRFVETIDSVFRFDDVRRALDHGVLPLFEVPAQVAATRVFA